MSAPAWLDPRPQVAPGAIAPRPAARTGRKLVLFDNGKLSPPFHDLAPIRVALHTLLQALGSVTIETSDLLAEPLDKHATRVAAWRAAGIDGIVFALCDAGVTQTTVMQAAAAELAGIPTAVLCTDQVIDLAATTASFLAPGLPLVCLELDRLMAAEAMTDRVGRAMPDIGRALTDAPDSLRAAATQRFPFVAGLARPATPPASDIDFADHAAAHDMTDGLPVRTPTPQAVAALLEHGARPASDVLIARLSPSGAALTVEQAAICAAMAGCPPIAFPLVLAALDALADPAYRLELASITTHPSGHLLLFSGPAAHAVGVHAGRGCLGPGNPVNSAISRAVNLAFINVARSVPGRSTLCLLGSPAQFSCCLADLRDSPYPDYATSIAGAAASGVLALRSEAPHNVMDHISRSPEALLTTFASVAATLGANCAYLPSDLIVLLNPEHAAVLARANWSRADIADFLWQHARNRRADILVRGVKPEWPAAWHDWEHVPVMLSPAHIHVVVAGAPGPHSAVSVAWGWGRAIWRPIRS